jgi:uncharacterized membrane protein
LLLVATVFIQSFVFLSVKISTVQTGALTAGFLVLAFGLMGLRALLWQKLLHYADLSLVYPFTSLVQIPILLYAVLLFNESLATGHFFGLILMLTGAFIMSGK